MLRHAYSSVPRFTVTLTLLII